MKEDALDYLQEIEAEIENFCDEEFLTSAKITVLESLKDTIERKLEELSA